MMSLLNNFAVMKQNLNRNKQEKSFTFHAKFVNSNYRRRDRQEGIDF